MKVQAHQETSEARASHRAMKLRATAAAVAIAGGISFSSAPAGAEVIDVSGTSNPGTAGVYSPGEAFSQFGGVSGGGAGPVPQAAVNGGPSGLPQYGIADSFGAIATEGTRVLSSMIGAPSLKIRPETIGRTILLTIGAGQAAVNTGAGALAVAGSAGACALAQAGKALPGLVQGISPLITQGISSGAGAGSILNPGAGAGAGAAGAAAGAGVGAAAAGIGTGAAALVGGLQCGAQTGVQFLGQLPTMFANVIAGLGFIPLLTSDLIEQGRVSPQLLDSLIHAPGTIKDRLGIKSTDWLDGAAQAADESGFSQNIENFQRMLDQMDFGSINDALTGMANALNTKNITDLLGGFINPWLGVLNQGAQMLGGVDASSIGTAITEIGKGIAPAVAAANAGAGQAAGQ